MLSIVQRTGHGAARARVPRRRILQAGGAGLFGLDVPTLLAAEASGGAGPARARSVIFLFLFGGPSQLETFDLKPDAPADIRGPFLPIASRTPDLRICEHLPLTAAVSDRFCVIRSMTHSYNDHSGGAHYIQTGHRWHVPVGGGFSATPKDWPSMGSVVEHIAQRTAGPHGAAAFPSYVVLPNRLGRLQDSGQYIRPGEYAGWLGQGFNPLTTAIDKRDAGDNPYWRDCADDEADFRLQGLADEHVLTLDRVERRLSLLEQMDVARRSFDASASAAAFDRFRERAVGLVSSPHARTALDIRREPAAIRDRYGRHLFGQSVLMARRLVEAGVRFVTVHYDCVDGYSWDSHRNSDDVRHRLLPTFDQAYSALVEDLDRRGLLEETLVVALGEMGRTPKPNATWGRGHWSQLFPALLAGGGIRGGTVHGASDRQAAEVVDAPTSPEDLAATIYDALGIDPDLQLSDAEGRPIPIVSGGRPLRQLFG
ncbi:MAG: DUF1501 domain-containing protein [Actinobacteria bacterium]|jgi:hypothetical protein|nr:DUF1501 domain-containing protein [Actinomycetota bacterium]